MNYKISKDALNQIRSFYNNVAKKYRNTWSKEDVKIYILATKQSIYQIENGLLRKNPTISNWQGLFMATTKDKKWNFAYKIEGDTIYIVDACHAQNMLRTSNDIGLTEFKLRRLIKEEVSRILQEEYEGYENYAEYAKYRPIGKKKFQTEHGNEIESVVTLKSGSGQMCHIVEDDHCYVLYNQLSFKDEAAPVTHIFPDAFEILKKLPNPQ